MNRPDSRQVIASFLPFDSITPKIRHCASMANLLPVKLPLHTPLDLHSLVTEFPPPQSRRYRDLHPALKTPPHPLSHVQSSSSSKTSYTHSPQALRTTQAVCHLIIHRSPRPTTFSQPRVDSVLVGRTVNASQSHSISWLLNVLMGRSGSLPRIGPTVLKLSRYFSPSTRSLSKIDTAPRRPTNSG